MKEIIVGCSHLGAGLAMNLQAKGHEVTIIDQNKETFKKLSDAFTGKTITGIGIHKEVLEKSKVDLVDAVIACTDHDETNALLARIAKNVYHVPLVIALISDPSKAAIYQSFGIQTISPITWGIQRVSELLTYNQLDSVWVPPNGNLEIYRVEAPALLIDRCAGEVWSAGEIRVIAIERDNKAFVPVSGTVFKQQDVLYIVAATSAINKLKAMLGLE